MTRKLEYAKWRDPEYIATYMREYNEKNRERLNECKRQYRRRRPDVKRLTQQKRRAVLKEGNLSEADTKRLIEKFGGKCLCCGSSENVCLDHIVPLLSGGTHTEDNLQPLCMDCNRKKSTKTIDYRKKEEDQPGRDHHRQVHQDQQGRMV